MGSDQTGFQGASFFSELTRADERELERRLLDTSYLIAVLIFIVNFAPAAFRYSGRAVRAIGSRRTPSSFAHLRAPGCRSSSPTAHPWEARCAIEGLPSIRRRRTSSPSCLARARSSYLPHKDRSSRRTPNLLKPRLKRLLVMALFFAGAVVRVRLAERCSCSGQLAERRVAPSGGDAFTRCGTIAPRDAARRSRGAARRSRRNRVVSYCRLCSPAPAGDGID